MEEEEHSGSPSVLSQCSVCLDAPGVDCASCGCVLCRKDDGSTLVICDVCDYFFHLACLDPPLREVPEGAWACPGCRRHARMEEEDEGGEKTKRKRPWGPSTKYRVCTKVPASHFGPIPGVEVGMAWKYRLQLAEEGVHRGLQSGMSGGPKAGVPSVVLSAAHSGNLDYGDEFVYEGSGGRERGKYTGLMFDQTLTARNLGLALGCAAHLDDQVGADAGEKWREGKPVRVVRTAASGREKPSRFNPEEGYRYDGIYKLVSYWPELIPTRAGAPVRVWKFRLRRDDPAPAPWTEEGAALCTEKGFACVYPEGYETKEAAKKKKILKEERSDRTAGEREWTEVDAAKDGNGDEGPKTMTKLRDRNNNNDVKEEEPVFRARWELKALILGDSANARLWSDLLGRPPRDREDFLEAVRKTFPCPACLGLPCDPTRLRTCGHTLCRACVGKVATGSAGGQRCPACQAPLLLGDAGDGDHHKKLLANAGVRNKGLRLVLRVLFPGYDGW